VGIDATDFLIGSILHGYVGWQFNKYEEKEEKRENLEAPGEFCRVSLAWTLGPSHPPT